VNKDNLIVKTALETIIIEMQALQNLQNTINQDFIHIVKTIYKMSGRVVVTGIGKSAIVAQKIVATFNSTGTPALFMHAADAIHGDLGMIKANDVVICISKSGDTPEIKTLVPLLKNIGIALIAMVSNKASYLGVQADYILHTPIEREADPNNLAPTTSTTAQMVMGDALATALIALRGFSPNDFAQYHPGGVLGKQLNLRVSDIYIHHERPFVYSDASLKAIIMEITSKRLGVTAVIAENERLLGIITDGDLRRMLEYNEDPRTAVATDIMSQNPSTITSDALATEALALMKIRSITQLLVVDDGQYLGVVHLHDLIKEGLI
jgi:arabinose-5-phosphate isomerase